jgi:hypothetical protein
MGKRNNDYFCFETLYYFAMRNLSFVFILALALLLGCKTSKTSKKAQISNEPVVVAVNDLVVEPVVNNVKEAVEPIIEEPIVMRSESFSIFEEEDLAKGYFDFYVIIGSFSSNTNAINLKSQLLAKSFIPVILKSETGMFRVAVNQTNLEQEARSVISDIRSKYPEHKDVWLLKKK